MGEIQPVREIRLASNALDLLEERANQLSDSSVEIDEHPASAKNIATGFDFLVSSLSSGGFVTVEQPIETEKTLVGSEAPTSQGVQGSCWSQSIEETQELFNIFVPAVSAEASAFLQNARKALAHVGAIVFRLDTPKTFVPFGPILQQETSAA